MCAPGSENFTVRLRILVATNFRTFNNYCQSGTPINIATGDLIKMLRTFILSVVFRVTLVLEKAKSTESKKCLQKNIVISPDVSLLLGPFSKHSRKINVCLLTIV